MQSPVWVSPIADAGSGLAAPDQLPARIRLLSFNIQSGIPTQRYHEYVTGGWRQVLHDPGRPFNLERIGAMLAGYDLIGLQEVDAGSLRSGFLNQVAFLAGRAHLPYWYIQRNRRLGRFAQHGNGLLSRTAPTALEDASLPSTIPGRGAIIAEYPMDDGLPLLVVSVHLSLGFRARRRQLAWLADRFGGRPRLIVMGDMNTSRSVLLERSPLAGSGLRPALLDPVFTYPSWRPRQELDHVLVSSDLTVHSAEALPCVFSDHLPLAVELSVTGRVMTAGASPTLVNA